MLDVVNKIHTAVPASCSNLLDGSSPLGINNPTSLNEEIPESDANQEPTKTPVSSTPATPTSSVWSGEADDLDDFYEDEDKSVASSTTSVAATPTLSSVADTPLSSETGTPTSTESDMPVSSELAAPTSSKLDTPTLPALDISTSVTPVSTTLTKPDYTSSVQSDPAIGSVTAIHGGPCSAPGHQMCLQSGEVGQWLTCNFGKWLSRDCATGLVCYDGINGKKTKMYVRHQINPFNLAGALYCDFPADIKAASVKDLPGAVMASPLLKVSPNNSV